MHFLRCVLAEWVLVCPRLLRTRLGACLLLLAFAADHANRIRQFAGCSYVTDSLGDGNVVSRTCGTETVRFHWTAESRLAALKVVGGDSLDFRYDASGRLVRKDVNAVPQSYFLWQGDNLLAELNATATGKVAEYSYYPGLDNPHAVITATTPHFAHVDGIGNVIALTDSAHAFLPDLLPTDSAAAHPN